MDHDSAMQVALEEARQAWGKTHPNPAVGAVIVHQGEIVARGHTQPAGGAHAEVEALSAWRTAGSPSDDSTTLYVTLEPCSTTGRTPPCTGAIVESGLRRVVVGATDPNPAHAGRGLSLLREAGLEVIDGVEAAACTALNPIFNYWITAGQPLLAAKVATTLDGRVATRRGHSKWITGEAARTDVHRWRRYFPAIAVGAGTVMADNPQLTARDASGPEWCPRRLIFDRNGTLFGTPALNVFTDAHADRTILVTANVESMPQDWKERGVTTWEWPRKGWSELLRMLAEAELYGLYVEGGHGLLADLMSARVLRYLFWYRAPILLGDSLAPSPFSGRAPGRIEDAMRLREVRREIFGDDDLVRGWLEEPGFNEPAPEPFRKA